LTCSVGLYALRVKNERIKIIDGIATKWELDIFATTISPNPFESLPFRTPKV
jgi:hypothetical protein